MGNRPQYSNEDVLKWHKDYQDMRVPARTISKKYGIKHDTLLNAFRRLNLWLRPKGFRPNNCHGKDGADNNRLRLLWFFKFTYKIRALRKNLEVTLTDDDFVRLVTSNCHYCGKSHLLETRLVNNKRVNMLTIDRIDSSKGYTPDNCVPSCKICNTIKMDQTYGDFLAQIKRIHSHLGLN
jgi:hypothetical protein